MDVIIQQTEISPREAYQRAKVEHYLDRATECFAMARYHATQRELDLVTALEPANQAAAELRDRTHERLKLLTRPLHADWLDNHQALGARRPEIVMVVDQDERVLTALTETFRGYGFPVVAAGTFDESSEVLSCCVPDVVLSEVNFDTGPRGFELFQRMKTLQAGNDGVFLFLVARLERNLEITGRRMGVDDFIVKPFDPDVVAATVMRCLSRRSHPAA
jgi:PleD family two-component response regulator